MKPRVYLAGPDVFDPQFEHIFAQRSAFCDQLGLEALVPFDNRLTTAEEIRAFNVTLIDSADCLIANITPFRGPHCDVGTAFEIGYAASQKKPIWAFSSSTLGLAERIPDPRGDGRDVDGMAIEPFELKENLMIAESLYDHAVYEDFESAAREASRAMEHRQP